MASYAKLLSEIFDEKTVRVLESLLHKDEVFYLRDLSRESGVSLATTHRIVQKLLKMGLVAKVVKNKIIYYQLIKSSPMFKELYQMIVGTTADPLTMLKDKLQRAYGEKASLYASKGGKRVFIIGNEINSDFLRETVNNIYNTTGKKLSVLTVSPIQFKQMKEMGLV